MRVGLLGCGWIQDFHARAIRELGGEVAAVANHRLPTAEAFAERHGIDRVTTDWRAVATDPGIDAVVVGTPNALHAEQSVAALEAGRHVLVEKPMAVTVAECDAMLAAASGSGASLMVAHCWRFHDAVRALRDRIAGGELGGIVKTRGYGVHAGWGPDGWFTDPALAGGGALLDMGVHAIDTARFLLGDPAPTQVRAVVGTRYGSYDVDDDAILLITWDQGTNSLVESGWWHPHKEGLEAETEVYGTSGYARIFPREEPAEDYEHCAQPMYTAQMREFLDAIQVGRPPSPSGADGRVVVQVAQDAYAAARRPAQRA
ncbi:MAG TPA: Gfo/Idh/MocA family oxidoreductase [Actinomycetota bacterium]|nr:Gfo/Idh/MocA family oxidoreductase [Actinomycetota bacterium]